MTKTPRSREIAELNDTFRRSMTGGKILITPGVASLSGDVQAVVIRTVATFDAFTNANDPHHERDFGAFRVAGHHVFWKIDYYDPSMQAASEDPADPAKTTRVLTIMLAEEY